MRHTRCCQYCGQALPETRHGVEFTRLESKIYDYILTAGDAGISNADLFDLVYTGKDANPHTLNVHIFNINEKMSDSGYQIVGRDVRSLQKSGPRYHDSDALTPEQAKALGL